MGAFRIGCTGWSYPDWVGPFYPKGTGAGEFLARYSRVFTLAEVDSSHYAAPTREATSRWARVTPADFTFAVKVPGAITHERRLRDFDGALSSFLDSVVPLAEAGKLGPLVAVLPPSFRREEGNEEALDRFLGALAPHRSVAIELRHGSWWVPETEAVLRRHRVALVWAVSEHTETPAWRTGDFVYARLIGDRSLTEFDRVRLDRRPEIDAWRPRLQEAIEAARETFVLVNNHFMGNAPQTVQIVRQAFGLPPADLAAARRNLGQTRLFAE